MWVTKQECGFTDFICGYVEDKDSGEPRISHRIDLSTGMYNGRQILKQKSAKEK